MTNEDILFPVIKKIYNKIKNGEVLVDRTGQNYVELICERIELNPLQKLLNFGVRKTPEKYCKAEVEWYNSKDLSIEKISKNAKMWKEICDRYQCVNSNYGWCIYSYENNNQYNFSLLELSKNRDSRRACMIYNRPSMWSDYNRNGMNDFICTFATQQFIRNDKLIYIVNMRSNDFIFGFFNDFYWHCEVYKKFINDYNRGNIDNFVHYDKIIWIANSLHVYERHFDMIKKMIDYCKK